MAGAGVYGSKSAISLFEVGGQLDADFSWQQDVKRRRNVMLGTREPSFSLVNL